MLPLRVHTLPGCELPNDLLRGNVELLALGDFEPGNESAEVLSLARGGTPLRFPAGTRAVSARVGPAGRGFFGYGERGEDGAVDVLLWPEGNACNVPTDGYPGRDGGQALGFASDAGLLLVAGGNDARSSNAILGALSLNVANGAVKALADAESARMQQPRAFASATPFGSGFLVAGGERPVADVPELDIEPQPHAEIFDPARGGFLEELLPLQSARTHHAAVTLQDGRTLLVGGRTKVGNTSIAQYQLEIVDPDTHRASVGEAILGRIDPTALRLSDGRIFVGGGTTLTGSLSTPAVEWLSADGRPAQQAPNDDVPARFERAFVAMPGGGVLAVGGCEDRLPLSAEDADACTRCAHGCEPTDGFDAWWIDRDGNVSSVSLEGIAAPRPLLLPGSDGRPWLVASLSRAPTEQQLFRFNPWAQSFEPASAAPNVTWPEPGAGKPIAIGTDTFAWIADAQLALAKLGERSRYAPDLALVLSYDPLDPSRPEHLVPDAPPGDAVAYSDGKLVLADPSVSVQVADTDYQDVTIRLQIEGKRLPLVLLGPSELGGSDCPWPDGDTRGGDADVAIVVRQGERAQLRYHGAESNTCAVGSGRLTLSLRAGRSRSVVKQLDIDRGAPR